MLLNLDEEDRIIKRRLAQKITFLKQETVPEDPSQEELKRFFEQNKANYYVPATYSFSHHYFSKESSAKERATKAFNDYQTNGVELKGDPFFLGKNFYQNSANLQHQLHHLQILLQVLFYRLDRILQLLVYL